MLYYKYAVCIISKEHTMYIEKQFALCFPINLHCFVYISTHIINS